jgi:hypothetical protein
MALLEFADRCICDVLLPVANISLTRDRQQGVATFGVGGIWRVYKAFLMVFRAIPTWICHLVVIVVRGKSFVVSAMHQRLCKTLNIAVALSYFTAGAIPPPALLSWLQL